MNLENYKISKVNLKSLIP